MKKVIAAVDAFNFTEQELRSYKYLAEKARGELTILFLENILGESVVFANANAESGYFDYDSLFGEEIRARGLKAEANKQKLKDFYRDNGMDVVVRELTGAPAAETIAESQFADLLLIRNTTSFAVLRDSNPPRFVRDLLADAHCPVMIIPENVHYIREIVFSYNGSLSSSYAIRQFTLLFGELSETPVKVVYVVENDEKRIPKGKLLKEYLNHHYEEVSYESFTGTPSAELMGLLLHAKNSVVTFGAYGRSRTSRFFHRSDADSLLRIGNVPVFITHP
ncbi:universal stress protein [Chitinophaga cymbidii]|uniref:Universal stress protein n=1 Tax=Chitinophaga cymbidii TaxID=1096750 RepID=A0A512RMU9_9BACT|nr:universal stress protein [Chitinophaga cymbidii]GEP97018.1 hypothetical protein CCY01nite_32780 [Chitinophaga cymbidii]